MKTMKAQGLLEQQLLLAVRVSGHTSSCLLTRGEGEQHILSHRLCAAESGPVQRKPQSHLLLAWTRHLTHVN